MWDALDDANCEWRPEWQRRLSLARVRDLIGEDDYAAGILPPAVPVWWFREMK